MSFRINQFISFLLVFLLVHPALAITTIRDAEIEGAIADIARPLFKVAGLNNDHRLWVISDYTLNAYTNGQDIFLNSGLLLKFIDDPEAIAGVIAHEIGHIKAKHLSKYNEKFNSLNRASLFGILLLMSGSMAIAQPELASGLLFGVNHIQEREMLRYSREQEQAADKIALQLLAKNNYSTEGLIKVMKYLRTNELNLANNLLAYSLTHPLSKERLTYLKRSKKITTNNYLNPEFKKYSRAMTKLKLFIEPIESLSNSNSSDPYIEAIIAYRFGNYQKAIYLIEQLLNQSPDPFLYELKAQFLFEDKKLAQAVQYYKKADELIVDCALIKLELAAALLELSELSDKQSDELILLAINKLNQVINIDPQQLIAYRQLAVGYGKINKLAIANFYLAKEALLMNEITKAKYFAKLAKSQLSVDDPYYIKAIDIIEIQSNP